MVEFSSSIILIFCWAFLSISAQSPEKLLKSQIYNENSEADSDSKVLITLIQQVPNSVSFNDPQTHTQQTFSGPGEIVIGKDVDARANLTLKCSALFPVQWIYSGEGQPETSFSTPTVKDSSGRYVKNLVLGSAKDMKELNSGDYICKRVELLKRASGPEAEAASMYIFVPGKSLFVRKFGSILKLEKGAALLRIPCAVSHPNVSVSLQRMNGNGLLQCLSFEEEVQFNPKSGFIVTSPKALEGKFLCVGSMKRVGEKSQVQVQLVEYAVKVVDSLSFDEGNPNEAQANQLSQQKEDDRFDDEDATEYHQYVSGTLEEDYVVPRNENTSSACFPSNPCGPNSICETSLKSQLPRCSCKPPYSGQPPHCRPECILDHDCGSPLLACQGHRCISPCSEKCGTGAICQLEGSNVKCRCPAGHIGNPEKGGKCGKSRGPSPLYFATDYLKNPIYSESESDEFGLDGSDRDSLRQNQNQGNRNPCEPWPCGPHSECKPMGNDAHCRCSKGYLGIPPHCHPECRRNSDCSGNRACIDSKCRDPCNFQNAQCGFRAQCSTMGHIPACYCPPGWRGDPYVKCIRPSMNQNQQQQRPFPNPQEQFPVSAEQGQGGNFHPHPPPNQQQPNSPCRNSPCGRNAVCTFRNFTVGCKCPPAFTGFGSDPYVECLPSPQNNQQSMQNPCEVCGPNSECVLSPQRPVECNCLPGMSGFPPNCRQEQYFGCQSNRNCEQHLHCFKGRCEDPCQRADCGRFAVCRGVRHQAVCACRNAPDHDPLQGCPP